MTTTSVYTPITVRKRQQNSSTAKFPFMINNRLLRLPASVLLNTVTTIAGRRRTLLLNVKPARTSVTNFLFLKARKQLNFWTRKRASSSGIHVSPRLTEQTLSKLIVNVWFMYIEATFTLQGTGTCRKELSLCKVTVDRKFHCAK